MLRKLECPNCRTTITSCVPCLVLDNTIDRVVVHMSEETKTRRKTMIEERKGASNVCSLIQNSYYDVAVVFCCWHVALASTCTCIPLGIRTTAKAGYVTIYVVPQTVPASSNTTALLPSQ